MRPMRSFGGGGGFGLAGVESMAARLAIGIVAGSVLTLLLKNSVGALFLLNPLGFFSNLWLWQPLTYAFVEVNPLGIIFGAIIMYSIGGALEQTWGSRRLLGVLLGGTVLAGVLTAVLMGLVFRVPGLSYAGGTVMTTLAWVAYGLTIGRGQANFWGIPLTGNMLAGIGAGFVVLNALTSSWLAQLPELFALAIAFAYVRGGSPRALMMRLQHWRLQRQLRGRSKHLRVMRDERPNDRYLN